MLKQINVKMAEEKISIPTSETDDKASESVGEGNVTSFTAEEDRMVLRKIDRVILPMV